MAWGWETANICQSKLSWVLLGFGEWKADKASPHTLGCTRQEESREDGTGGGGLGGGLLRFPPAQGYVHFLGLQKKKKSPPPEVNGTASHGGTGRSVG